MRLPLLLLLLVVTGVPLGCYTVTEPDPPPPLEPIPYDALGQGTLVFVRADLYVVDVDRRRARGFDFFGKFGPAVSPDGQRLLYTRHSLDDRTSSDVYLSDIDRSNEERLTNLTGYESYPAWLPDRQRIIFTNSVPGEGLNKYIYWQSAVFSPAQRVHTEPECLEIDGPISASIGADLVFAGRLCDDPATQGIFTVALDGGPVTLLVPAPPDPPDDFEGYFQLHAPSWSPDGRCVAFVEVLWVRTERVNELISLRTQVKLLDTSTGNILTLASLEQRSYSLEPLLSTPISLAWSPDGSKIAFSHRGGMATTHIYVVGRDGEGLQRITSAQGVVDASLSWGL